MARIRTIKPEFFRHEGLQDLEIENPQCYVMLVFAGLWGHCDSQGIFEYRPRQLKLDILPFLEFDMAKTLNLLVKAGFIEVFEHDGKQYGLIRSFNEHQRLSGKELGEAGVKHPVPDCEKPEKIGKQRGSNGEVIVKKRGSTWEAPGKHLGSSRDQLESQEREREKERSKGIGKGKEMEGEEEWEEELRISKPKKEIKKVFPKRTPFSSATFRVGPEGPAVIDIDALCRKMSRPKADDEEPEEIQLRRQLLREQAQEVKLSNG